MNGKCIIHLIFLFSFTGLKAQENKINISFQLSTKFISSYKTFNGIVEVKSEADSIKFPIDPLDACDEIPFVDFVFNVQKKERGKFAIFPCTAVSTPAFALAQSCKIIPPGKRERVKFPLGQYYDLTPGEYRIRVYYRPSNYNNGIVDLYSNWVFFKVNRYKRLIDYYK